jgi:hypothetical protein
MFTDVLAVAGSVAAGAIELTACLQCNNNQLTTWQGVARSTNEGKGTYASPSDHWRCMSRYQRAWNVVSVPRACVLSDINCRGSIMSSTTSGGYQ